MIVLQKLEHNVCIVIAVNGTQERGISIIGLTTGRSPQIALPIKKFSQKTRLASRFACSFVWPSAAYAIAGNYVNVVGSSV